ncbi:hypothetical protein [Teredinibacter franksiae]|uniref:hypothetical protein n=1 Tax=Teredinibacter franksiae TaxID=2761453 RepID=UPI00162802E6|nr:hypothetical protein [Teredinibacter franksiae]
MTEHNPISSPLRENTTHAETLAFTLTLTVDGNAYSVPGANIKQCELQAFSYGFSGMLGFYLPSDQREDELLEAFCTESLIDVELGISAVHNLPDPPPDGFNIKGLVTEKFLQEQAYQQVSGAPVLYRYYQIHFSDPAQVLWQQHFPSELYVDDCMSSVINTQVTAPIELAIDFAPAEEIQPMICLALGNTEHCNTGETGVKNTASFYEFLMDYSERNNGYFSYDYQLNSYLLSAEQPELQICTPFLPHEISHINTRWPEHKRSNTSLLNGLAENNEQSELENTSAVEGIKHDILLRQSIESRFSDRKDLERNKLRVKGEQLSVQFSQWPLQNFWPGCEIQFNSDVDGRRFFYADKSYRTHAVFISAKAIDSSFEKDIDLLFTQYHLQCHAQAHKSDAPQPTLPEYRQPAYPLYVEGLVVSKQGADGDKTFDVTSNDTTGQFEYAVNIPLWGLTIKVMLEPDFLNSHFYFPFYRDTKLLLSLDLYRAHIHKVLSWGDGVQLPMATQGNHILFGKNSQDQTSLSHIYEDNKPVLAIKRNKENDTELVRLEEGSIILQTKEAQ